MEPIKVTLVDDHNIFLDGLNILLDGEKSIDVVSKAKNGKEFIDGLSENIPEVVLMDIEMPEMNGIETTEYLSGKFPYIKVIALSMHGDDSNYYNMIQAGAKGFLLKDTNSEELLAAIKTVANDENYFSQELLRKIIFNFGGEKLGEKKEKEVLSKREIEVLSLICNGLSNAEIAESMHISQRTVEGHRANLLRKADVKNTASLIIFAIKYRYVEI